MTSPECEAFVATVEMLLTRRRDELAANLARPDDAWGPRAWTRAELEDTVYASYKPMRQGRVTRPPRREKVMEIADYLGCTLDERNALLIAAEYAPVEIYRTGTALEAPLRIARDIAQSVRLPAIVINRDWRIHHINAHVFALNGLDPVIAAHALPSEASLLQLLFDPHLPLYRTISRNHASWTRMVRQTIFAFKKANVLSRFEPWYAAHVSDLMALPQFENQWTSVDISLPADEAAALSNPIVLEMFTEAFAEPLRLRPLLISVGYFEFDYPQVIAFAPADEVSGRLMSARGMDGL